MLLKKKDVNRNLTIAMPIKIEALIKNIKK